MSAGRLPFLLTSPMKMEQEECTEISVHKIQKPGSHSKDRIQHYTALLMI